MRTLYSKMKLTGRSVKVMLLAACALIGVMGAHAQTPVNVSGTVSDSRGGVMAGVTVVLKGQTAKGVITDGKGHYSITVPSAESELTFSFVGFKPQTIKIGSRTVLNVVLEEDLTQMDEVVVIGYGTQKRKFIIGSVSSVGSKELTMAPASNVSNMMTGKLPGLTSIQRSGQPGADETNLLIRGVNTFSNASPLTLVDGVERMINLVNPADIESISVLKDAATAAIYGKKSMNGVILITTKKGASEQTKISYDFSGTFSTNAAFPKFLNGPDYIKWYNKASMLEHGVPAYDADIQTKVINGDPNGVYGNTDWFDLLFKNYGFTQQHTISAQGGNEKIRHYTSVGLMDQDGIVNNTSYQRYNVRSNIDTKIRKNLTLSMNLSAYYSKQKAPGLGMGNQLSTSPFSQAVFAAPIINPTYNGLPFAWSESGAKSNSYNPVAAVENSGFQNHQVWAFQGTAKLQYDFGSIKALEGLKASLEMSYDYSNTTKKDFMAGYDVMVYNRQTKAITKQQANGTADGDFFKSASNWASINLRPTIEYNRTFGKHTVGALLLYEQQDNRGDNLQAQKQGYDFTYPIDIWSGTRFPEGVNPATGSFTHTVSKSYAVRANYAYADKYLVEFTGRYDGDYYFAPSKRWGFFPSVAVGWVMSEEKFFKDAFPKVNQFKIRGSIGQLGINDASPWMYLRTYGYGTNSGVFGGEVYNTFYTNSSVVSDLTWAKARNYNVGFDLTMWGGLLGVEFDYFYKYTFDIQDKTGTSFPNSLGGNYASLRNSGRLDNRGMEVVLKHFNRINKDWSYSLVGSFAYNKNRILSKVNDAGLSVYQNVIGHSISEPYGYVALGLAQTAEQVANAPVSPSSYGKIRLGDLLYKDINGDGKIDKMNDMVSLGYGPTPRMSFSLNMNVAYKGIELSALWQGVAQCDYLLSGAYNNGSQDNTTFTRPFYEGGNAPYYLVEGSWRPDHTNAKYPRLSTEFNGNNAVASSWWLVNGNYLRLKNLQLAYSLPSELLRRWKTGISNVRIYVAGTNLFTLTEFKYLDPEAPSVSNGYYPQQRTYSIGLNITF